MSNLEQTSADLAALLNVELAGHPINIGVDYTNVLHVKIRPSKYLDLKGHPVNPSDEFIKLVYRLAPTGYKVNWNNTCSCFWLTIKS